MRTRTLYRLSGAALTISAATLALVTWLERYTGPDLDLTPPLVRSAAVPTHLVSFVAFLLFVPGLTGLYLAHRERLGTVGSLGFVAVGLGFSLGALPHTVLDFSAIPVVFDALPEPQATELINRMYSPVGALASVGLPLAVLGVVVVGVATLRAHTLPRWASVVGLASVPAAVLLGVATGLLPGAAVPHPPVALDLGLACYGVALLLRAPAPDAAAPAAVPVRA